ncbi:MAG: hypothetical protein HWQ44_21525 [Nostoc sp. JL34]|uniref:hypothetical protein n=1 Tax=Nostoc sp. JL34 TaxID=2815397 RepID=UPI001D83B5B6|nr:hypothetical protein [Nostoc sp. JL34]MBN3885428.1 hypothetical protein [Nostoc sp. JL34]
MFKGSVNALSDRINPCIISSQANHLLLKSSRVFAIDGYSNNVTSTPIKKTAAITMPSLYR